MKYRCLSCNKEYSNKIDEELTIRFKNTFENTYHEKVFIFVSTWMNGKSLVKQHYLKKIL